MRKPIVLVLLSAHLASACTGQPPAHLQAAGRRGLAPCPDTPNCVASHAEDPEHAIEPIRYEGGAEAAWTAVRRAVESLPRTTIVREEDGYLHAECRSMILRFVDDLELQLQPDAGIIAVRSASRLGRSDFGVNRKRVERLRAAMAAAKDAS